MGAEKGKKGKVNLMFLVGSRVLKRLSVMSLREQALTATLKWVKLNFYFCDHIATSFLFQQIANNFFFFQILKNIIFSS